MLNKEQETVWMSINSGIIDPDYEFEIPLGYTIKLGYYSIKRNFLISLKEFKEFKKFLWKANEVIVKWKKNVLMWC